ncbi:hypothetical protein [Streptomyces sp. C10-9-1]|uniref:hypothetical protein n=1 Tax=Streptomyces sp. C10-9-1 TaxID=1859285 RepID=UPI003F4A6A4B
MSSCIPQKLLEAQHRHQLRDESHHQWFRRRAGSFTDRGGSRGRGGVKLFLVGPRHASELVLELVWVGVLDGMQTCSNAGVESGLGDCLEDG